MIRTSALLLLVSPLLLSGCAGLGLATGAAATVGIAAAQEGGLNRAATDSWIKLQINESWFRYDVETFAKLSTRVNQGRVLLTGVVQDPEDRVEAVRLVWQVPGVKQVINEIRVAKSTGIKGFVQDGWITSRLRAQLTLDRSVQSINYSIDTVQGIVYLMGVARNQAELNQVIETARTIAGVRQVVSYVKMSGEPIEPAKVKDDSQAVSTTINNAPVTPVTVEEEEYIPVREIEDNQPPSIEDAYYN
jgi:osmotically-inducible protein OsmY